MNLLSNNSYAAIMKKPSLILLVIFALGFLHSYWYMFYQPDDAFIYLVYVNSFLNGEGLTFNGELVEGYSSILWLLLVTVMSWGGVDSLVAAKFLGWASYLIMGGVLAWVHRSTISNDRPAYLVTLILYFLLPTLAMWASGAMEAVLFSLIIVVASVSYFYTRIINPSMALAIVSGISFGLVSLTRPEGFALVGAIIVFEMVLFFHGKKVNLKYMLTALACYSIITSIMFLGRHAIYGDWFPVTVGAKTGDLAWQMQLGGAYIVSFLKQYFVLSTVYVAATIYAFIRQRENHAQYFLVWMSTIIVFGYLLFNFLVGGDWMIGWRFLVPILPFIALTIGIVLGGIEKRVFIIVACILCVELSLASSGLHKDSYKQTQSDKGDILMGKYIKSLGLSSSEKIAVIDAGAIPYYAELPTIDMIGLNNSHISKLPGGFLQKYDNDYVLSHKPEIIQFHTKYINKQGDVAPTEAFRGSLVLFYTPEFQRWYQRDINSPVSHLFRRRETPLEQTFIDSYFQAEMSGSLNALGKLNVSLKKVGDGIWLSQESDHREAGVVYFHVIAVKNNGQVIYEGYKSIPKQMNKSDEVTVNISIPDIKFDNYRVIVCPVLLGVRKLDICHENGGLQFPVGTGRSPVLNKGSISFNDDRLSFYGWSNPEKTFTWSLGKESFIEFYSEGIEKSKHLNIDLEVFGNQSLDIYLNETLVYSNSFLTTSLIELTDVKLKKGMNKIKLVHPKATSPSYNDTRVIAIGFKQLELR